MLSTVIVDFVQLACWFCLKIWGWLLWNKVEKGVDRFFCLQYVMRVLWISEISTWWRTCLMVRRSSQAFYFEYRCLKMNLVTVFLIIRLSRNPLPSLSPRSLQKMLRVPSLDFDSGFPGVNRLHADSGQKTHFKTYSTISLARAFTQRNTRSSPHILDVMWV